MEDNSNKYLPKGFQIANKYEIIEVLGEDAFEILYLVRDIHRKGSFFVLKELFFETFSFREEKYVTTVIEARDVFNKRKKQIIEEIKAQKLSGRDDEIKTYGYEEENDTIYTIMEFSNNASLEKYLPYIANDGGSLPSLSDLLKEENRSIDFSFFLKVFLGMLSLLAMAYFAYKFFQKTNDEPFRDSLTLEVKELPKLKDRQAEIIQPIYKTPIVSVLVDEVKVDENEIKTIEKVVDKKIDIKHSIEHNITVLNTHKVDTNSSRLIIRGDSVNKVNIVAKRKAKDEIEKEKKVVAPKVALKLFLDAYINSISHESADKTLTYYDTSVKRYFKFKNPSHKTISKSQEHYNKKWSDRAFKMLNFAIVKEYKKNNIAYFDLKTTTSWTIKNKRGKKLSGKSRGKMTLKKIEDGFKITSIN